jgi:hypothetical protein
MISGMAVPDRRWLIKLPAVTANDKKLLFVSIRDDRS